jgi:rod shape-determining protein MreD
VKRIVALLALGALAPMIQGVAGSFVAPRYCPDLGLLLVAGLGLRWRSAAGGAALSAALGFIADLFSGSLLGQHALLRLFAFGAIRVCSRRFNLRGAIPLMIFAIAATAISGLGSALLSAFFAAASRPDPALLGELVPHALITASFAPPVVWIVDRISSWLGEADPGRSVLLPPRSRAA